MKCNFCGKEFTPKRAGNIYCGKECAIAAFNKGQKEGFTVYERTCPVCLEKFKTTNPTKIYCCSACAMEYRDIAAHVLRARRPKIRKLLCKVQANPTLDIDELLRKEYPKL